MSFLLHDPSEKWAIVCHPNREFNSILAKRAKVQHLPGFRRNQARGQIAGSQSGGNDNLTFEM